jgi:hypothetical protein
MAAARQQISQMLALSAEGLKHSDPRPSGKVLPELPARRCRVLTRVRNNK